MSATPVVPAAEVDPWADEFTFIQRDEERGTLQQDIEALAAEQLAEQQAEDEAAAAEEEARIAAEQPVPEPVAVPVAEPEQTGPKVTTHPDGSSVSVEKTSRGWKAELDLGLSGATKEVFYGTTKDEMWLNVAVAKLNATKKIREQNRQIKLGAPPKQSAVSPAPVAPQPLTADQIVALKQKLEQNPDAGFAEWIQLRTGRSIETLVQQADAGAQAREEGILSDTATAFVASHPEYYKSDNNFRTIVAYVSKHKLGKILDAQNQDTILTDLVRSGEWTASNLDEAYEDLRESGLLEVKPVAPTPVEPVTPVRSATPSVPAPAPVAPAPVAAAPVPASPAATPSRVTRQPRAGFGIRTSETTSVPAPSSNEPPSAQSLDQLSDADIAQLMAGVRQTHFAKR